MFPTLYAAVYRGFFIFIKKFAKNKNIFIIKRIKTTTWDFVFTPFMKKIYKEKDKTILKYIKNIEKWVWKLTEIIIGIFMIIKLV